jgi:hypothetical protein
MWGGSTARERLTFCRGMVTSAAIRLHFPASAQFWRQVQALINAVFKAHSDAQTGWTCDVGMTLLPIYNSG